jgi:uncharacterized protein
MCITRFLYSTTKFEKKTITYGKRKFNVEIADSFGKEMLGLMHRKSIAANGGMLFNFHRDGKYDIWMLNMKFGIDIIWMDSEARILKIERNAKPCKSIFSCPAYVSPPNARYILELNAGAAARERMKEGESFILYPIKGFQNKG